MLKILSLLALSLSFPQLSNAAEDPFLWLENVDSAQSLDWVKSHNASTLGKLETRAIYPVLERELKEILTSNARLPAISLHGDKVYNFWQDSKNPRGIWRRTTLASYKTAAPEWETVLDLDALDASEGVNWVWKAANCLEPASERCLISLSRGGGDAVEIREFDIPSKAFVTNGFKVPEAKSDVSWVDQDTILVGTDFGPGSMSKAGYPLIAKKWKRGTPLSEAVEMIHGQPDDMTVSAFVSQQPGWQPEFLVRYMSFYESEISLVLADGKTARLPLPTDASFQTTIGSKAFFLLQSELKTSTRTFSQGSLVAYPLLRAAEGEASLNGLELVFAPTSSRFLSEVYRSGNYLLLNVLDNVRGKLLRARRGGNGWQLQEISIGENGMAEASAGDAFNDNFLASYMDFLTPTTQFLGQSSKLKVEALKSSPVFFDSSNKVTEQFEATSKDSTKVPYFVTHRKDLPLDGSNPTLLYGYGGFKISMTPWYSAGAGKAWLEKGGVFVVANIRGGGEFGPAWHESARKANKQRSYDDFIAIAEDLIARRITSPAHLGIQGGSNGGLLMGAVTMQRPDLFGAVLCEVPLLDMMRYHLLLAGNSWMDEYGNPDIAQEREWILQYSPYQNVKAGVKYPEIFFTTSTRDDRVHPGHARKMAALLESMGSPVYYFENMEGGHGGSSTPEQKAKILALEYSYLWEKLK
jgi:prolyl oligopeptidase